MSSDGAKTETKMFTTRDSFIKSSSTKSDSG